MLALVAGDIVLTRSRSGLLGSIIRKASARPWDPTYYNHVGIITTDGDERTAQLVEALWHVRKGPLWYLYGPPAGEKRPEIGVFRLCGPTRPQREIAAAAAELYVGRKYGFWKLFAHAADGQLSLKTGREVTLFRRLLKKDKYPICSYLVAKAWAEAGVSFEVPPGTADPDDLHNYVLRPGQAAVIFVGVLE